MYPILRLNWLPRSSFVQTLELRPFRLILLAWAFLTFTMLGVPPATASSFEQADAAIVAVHAQMIAPSDAVPPRLEAAPTSSHLLVECAANCAFDLPAEQRSALAFGLLLAYPAESKLREWSWQLPPSPRPPHPDA